MRNLKRALSLAVSTVMLVGMMAVGTSAASYADVTSEHNEEAIGVMQAVSVMVGDENGNFNPDKNVTRAEMAVVMANLLDLQVQDFVGASIPFTDVPEWARAYVAACYADGITGGISATEYGSNNSITAVQGGLMMLKALGYFQYGSDFGTDWQVATIRQASNIGLFNGLSSARNEALTRNDVAQLALNTLEARTVEPTGSTGGQVTTGDTTIIIGGNVSYEYVTSSERSYNRAISGDTNNDGDCYLELGEKLFEGDLTKDAHAASDDAFQRPAVTWTYNNDTVGTYADGADETYVVDDTGLSVMDVLTDPDYMNYRRDREIDIVHTPGENDTWKAYNTAYLNGEEITNLDADLSIGDVVEAYEEDGVVTSVVVRRYTAAVVDSIDTDLSSSEERNGASVELTIKSLDGDVDYGTWYDDYNDADEALPGYTAAYEEGTVLAIALNGGDGGNIIDTYAADVVTGAVTGYRAGKTVTIDGTRYSVAAAAEADVDGLKIDEEHDVYLTAEGYVIGIEGATGVNLDDVYYVTGVYSGSGSYGGRNYYAQAVSLADGTVEEIELDADDAGALENKKEQADTAGNNGFANVGGLYTFDNGEATKYTTNDDYTVVADASLRDDVAVDASRLDLTSGGRYYLDDTTQYLAIDGVKGDIEVVAATGGMRAAEGDTVFVIADSRDAVYVLYIDANASVSSADVVYVADTAYDVVGSDEFEYDVYYVESGNAETLVVDERIPNVGFYEITDENDGVYTVDPVSDEIGNTVDTDFEGALSDVNITNPDNLYRNALTGWNSGKFFDDVAITGTIADERANIDREINSFSRLQDAVEAGGVVVDLYVTDGEITFICVTGSSTEVASAEDKIDGAVDNADGAWGQNGDLGNYVAHGAWTAEGTSVTATFQAADLEEEFGDLYMSWDAARFLGSLHDQGVKTIIYDGVVYTWDAEGGLQGSNWYNAADEGLVTGESANTLVKALDKNGIFDDNGGVARLIVDNVMMTITFDVK